MTQDTTTAIRAGTGLALRLDRLSQAMGIPPERLAVHALEHWVAEQERALALIEALAEDLGGEMGPRLKAMLHTGLFTRQQPLDSFSLSASEVDAVAEQEHLSERAAAGLGRALLRSESGVRQLERMMLDQIDQARYAGDGVKAEALEATFAEFRARHPVASR
jgi:predicted transcriptional regulator